ncbi:TIGR02281 family clan AA aspartic protease [Zoogloea sp.]|jgi:clan AA aspartic protease (TIGR02281 family)|uniref:retropepsin-like aspartic protease family protein n=1 Tax=Zoogloea sp. TaxID=49181 RepID=UPI0035B2A853
MPASPPPRPSRPAARAGGWILPALFWTGLIVLGTAAASWWLGSPRGSKAFEVIDGDVLELRLGRGGHYEVGGAVAAVPVRFIVDTGASLTSIPQALGERIGIRACPAVGFDLSRDDEPGCCRPEVFRTANGSVEACVARVPSVRFGAFELRNPRVAVMPGMDGQALLGMDVLRHFSLSQEGGRLRISRAAR